MRKASTNDPTGRGRVAPPGTVARVDCHVSAAYARVMEPAARVQACFFDDSFSGAVVVWNGEAEVLVHSPSIYLDEVLLRDRKRDALRFLEDVEGFFQAQQIHGISDMPSLAVTVIDDEPGLYSFPSIVTTQLLPTFAAKSSFDPRRKAPRMLYPAFWAYWNQLIRTVGPAASANIRDNIVYQCEWYRANGFAYRNLGKAVAHAAARGASDRLAEEIGSAEDLTLAERGALRGNEQHPLG